MKFAAVDRFEAASPGVVYARARSDTEEVTFDLLQGGTQLPATAPPAIQPPGLDLARRRYLYTNIRQFVKADLRDLVCPLPEEEVEVRPEGEAEARGVPEETTPPSATDDERGGRARGRGGVRGRGGGRGRGRGGVSGRGRGGVSGWGGVSGRGRGAVSARGRGAVSGRGRGAVSGGQREEGEERGRGWGAGRRGWGAGGRGWGAGRGAGRREWDAWCTATAFFVASTAPAT